MNLFFWKKKETGPVLKAGKIAVSRDLNGLLLLKVSGVLTPQAVSNAQAKMLAIASQGTRLRGLIDMQEFQGWAKGFDGGTSDVEKMFAIDAITDRIAVVAESKRHENLGMFMTTWMRKAQIKFFALEDMEQAKAWLKG